MYEEEWGESMKRSGSNYSPNNYCYAGLLTLLVSPHLIFLIWRPVAAGLTIFAANQLPQFREEPESSLIEIVQFRFSTQRMSFTKKQIQYS